MWTNLIKAREAKGWNKAQLAERSSISQTYIGELEAGKKQPTVKTVKKLAKALDVTVEYLIADLVEDEIRG
jgi:transcriptional regulator with XRE-family HTH domain